MIEVYGTVKATRALLVLYKYCSMLLFKAITLTLVVNALVYQTGTVCYYPIIGF